MSNLTILSEKNFGISFYSFSKVTERNFNLTRRPNVKLRFKNNKRFNYIIKIFTVNMKD